MRVLASTVLVLAACSPALEPAPAGAVRPAALVRVATWNVHDLFDEADRVVPPGEEDAVPSHEEVEAKLGGVAAVLARIGADVVFLQEVENLPLLRRLAARAGYAQALLVEGEDPRGIDVAALSRLPVDAYVSHLGEVGADGRPLWPRDCVEIHARAGEASLVVVGSHFSSALSDDGTRRAAQAARLREIADAAGAAHPGALVLAGGDLNDAAGSAALAPLLGDGAWFDAAPAGAVTWTSATRTGRLDYLLLPRGQATALVGLEIASGADVAAASDHRPVVADIWVQ